MNNRKSEFKTVFSTVDGSDAIYRFLQVVFNLFPEDKFHHLLRTASFGYESDEQIYKHVQQKLSSIKPFLSELSYALPALSKQKKEMSKQAMELLGDKIEITNYIEIGATGRYISDLKKNTKVSGKIYIINDFAPDYSLPEIMERGQISKLGSFVNLNNYDLNGESLIPAESIDLITCHIGLHHCPAERLDSFIRFIHQKLRKGGVFILRDHDVRSDDMATFCSLVHTIFNLGTGVPWETNEKEYRSFRSIDEWSELVCRDGFSDSGKRLLQENDPSDNTMVKLVKN